MILHITSPSKDKDYKAMYEKFMAEEFCPFCVEDRMLGYLMGARAEDDGYVLTVSITDQYAMEHFHELMRQRSISRVTA